MSKKHPSPSLPFRELFQLRPKTIVRHGLDKLSGYIDFEAFRPKLEELCHYSENGRPHYDVVVMFRILILQTLYDLSDEDTEHCIYDRRSFQNFVGLRGVEDIPNARTIWAFRERLGAEGARGLFDTFWKVMEEAGIKFSKGVAIDASFQEAPRKRNSREENKRKRAKKDMDARWAKKGDETHYGYKNHVAADVKTKLIRDYRVTPASDHDISVFEDIIPEHTRDIYADSAYMSAPREAALKAKKKRPHIVKRKTRSSAPLTGRQKHINHVISKKRCRVEHVFGQIKQFGGDTVRSIGMARCAVRVALVNIVYNMLRFACLKFQ
ncbi:MAG: IS5 family transposase, partial [Akkermansia sp.]|nr:IS5 family transposase [Akkermansia sp.]